MALPSSGAISFDNLRTERAVAGSVSLADMYRGGSKVPVTAGTTNIPTSGAIDMADFYSQQLYPYGLTFVAGTLQFDKVSAGGFSLGTSNAAATGSSNGSFKSGNGTRMIMCQFTNNQGIGPIFLFAQKTTSAASNSCDIHTGSISGISGATITLRNGTATSGSSIYSGTLNTSNESSDNTILTSSSAYQANNQVRLVHINGNGQNATLTSGNTYTWTFG